MVTLMAGMGEKVLIIYGTHLTQVLPLCLQYMLLSSTSTSPPLKKIRGKRLIVIQEKKERRKARKCHFRSEG